MEMLLSAPAYSTMASRKTTANSLESSLSMRQPDTAKMVKVDQVKQMPKRFKLTKLTDRELPRVEY